MEKLKFCTYIESESDFFHMDDLIRHADGGNEAHFHDFYEIFVVLEGEFLEHSTQGVHLIKKGELRFVQPDLAHYFESKQGTKQNILRNIAIEKKCFEHLLSFCPTNPFEQREVISYRLKEKQFQYFMYQSNEAKFMREQKESYQYLLRAIVVDLLASTLMPGQSSEVPMWLRTAYEEMKKVENFLQGATRMVTLSDKTKEHLSRELKKHYNTTISAYVNELRISYAAELLEKSNLQIIELMYESGYENVSYFNRVFQDKYGMTPKQYRSRIKYF